MRVVTEENAVRRELKPPPCVLKLVRVVIRVCLGTHMGNMNDFRVE